MEFLVSGFGLAQSTCCGQLKSEPLPPTRVLPTVYYLPRAGGCKGETEARCFLPLKSQWRHLQHRLGATHGVQAGARAAPPPPGVGL